MKNHVKIIFHIDLNQFFATVAVLKNPLLKGKIFAIGRDHEYRGVITSATYEARQYKIHAGMPIYQARKLCPQLQIVPADFEAIRHYSKLFFQLLKEYDPNLEQSSIDECYMDVTEITLGKNRHPVELAEEIQRRALQELSLPCSIGIAPTLFLAKMASDLKKPLGISVLRIREIEKILYPLSVKSIYGIGKKTYPNLEAAGILTIRDFMEKDALASSIIGKKHYDETVERLRGKSSNIVDPNQHSVHESISKSKTYDTYLVHEDKIKEELLQMSEELHRNLIAKNYMVKTVNITLRNSEFKTITRSKTVPYTQDKTLLNYYIEDLVDEHYNGESLRLVGCGFSNLKIKEEEPIEITLFNVYEIERKKEVIQEMMSSFQSKYGTNALYMQTKELEDQNH